MGELRAFEDIKSIPVTESLLKKVNEKVKVVKPKLQIKKKQKRRRKRRISAKIS